MNGLGFDFVSDVPTPVKLLFAALGVVMLVWVLAAWAFGDRDSDPGELP